LWGKVFPRDRNQNKKPGSLRPQVKGFPAILLEVAYCRAGFPRFELKDIFRMLKRHPLSVFFLLCTAISSGIISSAQSAPSALRSPITLTIGGTASAFDPDYVQNKLIGIGAYVDLDIPHHLGIEAEGRWQRFREFEGISQDNYLIGPRYRFHRIWKAQPYAKALVGYSNMNFEDGFGTGRFTTVAFGGGLDLRVDRHWSVRVPDVEYQYWPSFLNGSLHPYGVSAGISYRLF
jgi:hypothetical protein